MLKKLHVCTLQNLAMYRGSVSTFADLSVALGAAPCHVQRVHFWHLKSAYFLETRWGPPLFEAPGCHLAVAVSCVTLLYVADSNNTIQESIWVGRQTHSQGGTGFRMLRAQFCSLVHSKRGPKVDPRRIESGPSWRVCLWPLYFIRCAESALQAAMCAKSQAWSYFNTNSIRGGNLELGRPVFTSLVFLVFLGPKNRPFFVTGRSKSRPNATFDPWAGSSTRDRPGIPPLPPETKIKVQVSAKWRHFCEAASCSSQSLCVCRCCKEWLSYFAESLCGGGAGERAHIWEIVADKVASKPLLME